MPKPARPLTLPTPTQTQKLFTATLGVALASSAASLRAAAQETEQSATQLEKVSVEEVVEEFKADTASSPKYTAALVDTPKSVTVITAQVMESTGATSLVEALRTTPGITLGAGEGGNPVGDRPFLRGFDAQSSTYIDGMRDIGAQSREVFNLEAVEVTKGPDGTVGGRGSAGGSLNLVSKTGRAENFLRGTLGLGTADYKRATVDGNITLGETAALRLNALYHDADVAGRDEVYNNRWGVAPSIAFGLGTRTPITLSHYHLQSDNLPDTGVPYDNPTLRSHADAPARVLQTGDGRPVDVDLSNFYGLKNRDFYRDHADTTTLQIEHQFNEHAILRNVARYSRTAQNYVWTQPDDSQGNIYYGYVWRRINTRATTVHTVADQLSLSGLFATGAIQHSYAAGFEISREQGENYSYVATPGTGSGAMLSGTAPNQVMNPNWSCGDNVGAAGGYNCTSLFDPDPNDPWAGTMTRSANPSNAESNTRSIYVFDTLTLTPKWLLSLGARTDHYETETLGVLNNNARARLAYSDDLFNWQAGLVFKPLANGSIYTSYATSSTPLNATLAQGSESQGLSATTQDLEPEKNRSYELGTKWDLAGNRLALTAALFRTETTNARITQQDGTIQMAGEKRVQGVELGASGSITDKWQVFGGYTMLDSELVRAGGSGANFGLQDGQPFPNTPKHSASLWTTFQVLPNLTLGGGGNYMAKVYGGVNPNAPKWVPSYVRLDAMANYTMSDRYTLQLNVQNLADKRYFDRAYAAHYASVAPGRSATVSLSARL